MRISGPGGTPPIKPPGVDAAEDFEKEARKVNPTRESGQPEGFQEQKDNKKPPRLPTVDEIGIENALALQKAGIGRKPSEP